MNGIINTPPPLTGYDIIIRTQAEFDRLIASPDWLGAHSVLFVGDGGNQTGFLVNSPIVIPPSMKALHGISASLVATSTGIEVMLSYETRPTTSEYSLRGIKVMNQLAGGDAIGIANCRNVADCSADVNATMAYGFSNCHQLCGCFGFGRTSSGVSSGFIDCVGLTDCYGGGFGNGVYNSSHAFKNCRMLMNCHGHCAGSTIDGIMPLVSDANVSVFETCELLTNCQSETVDNDSSVHFTNCKFMTNCTDVPNNNLWASFMTGCSHYDAETVISSKP